jgi:hypothetical protein
MFRAYQKMYIFGHQEESMDSNAMSPGMLFPGLGIILAVLWLDKTGFAVSAALNDMAGIPWKVQPWSARHSSSFA